MSKATKVTVAGAGALGLTAALALADAGCAVTVFDPSPETSASSVAAGMIAPVFEAVLDPEAPPFDLMLAARDLWPALAARTGVELDRSGAMAVGSDAWLAEVEVKLSRLGLHGADLPGSTAGAFAPGLSRAFHHAVLVNEDWRVEPRQALAALRRAAEGAGVAFRKGRVNERGAADWLVVATGAARDLAPELADLVPIKGHILRVSGLQPGSVSLRGEGIYAVPAAGGWSIGATMEVGVADPAPDPVQAEDLMAAGAQLIPALADGEAWLFAGVRAATRDGVPLAGLSSAANTILATGARRNGWLLAPLVAKAVVAAVTGAESGPHARRLDPSRLSRG